MSTPLSPLLNLTQMDSYLDEGMCPISQAEEPLIQCHLGEIREDVGLAIIPEVGSALKCVPLDHASLDATMTSIAKHIAGACELDSQDWG